MDARELDRVLAGESLIVPSSGFVDRVMEAVRQDVESPPLPFPWRRAWPLAAGLAGVLVWLAITRLVPASMGEEAMASSVDGSLSARVTLSIVGALVATVLPLRWCHAER